MAYFVQQERKTTKNAPVHWNFNMRRKQKSFAEQLDSSRSAFLAVLGKLQVTGSLHGKTTYYKKKNK
jgi:selenophosphate synthetase-related protein